MVKKEEKQNYEQLAKLQAMDQQIKMLEQQFATAEMKVKQITQLKEVIKNINYSEKDSCFSEIGLGIYAETKMNKQDKFLINIGANILAKRSKKEIKNILEFQLTKLEEFQQQIINEIERIAKQAEQNV